MAKKDQEKWNNKYKNTPKLLESREPCSKLQILLDHITSIHLALDVACGAGKNSIYMAKKGIKVDAMDISQVALEALNKQGLKNIHTHLVDFDNYIPQENHYDLIVKTNFLHRALIPKLISSVKSKGYLFIETYMHHDRNEKNPSNQDYLLQKEELKSFFKEGFDIIEYEEFDNEPEELYQMRKQAIIVQKK